MISRPLCAYPRKKGPILSPKFAESFALTAASIMAACRLTLDIIGGAIGVMADILVCLTLALSPFQQI
jgi:hypothetical protein